MNRQKIALVERLGVKKDDRSREQLLQETDVYISTLSGDLSEDIRSQLPEKAVVIALRASQISLARKQALVSTLPSHPNHVTDLQIAAVLLSAVCEGKKMDDKSLKKAVQALATYFGTPKSDRLVPGLLEKNLVKKLLKKI